MKNIILIYNPTAGNEGANHYLKRIEKHLNKYFDEVVLAKTKREGHAAELSENASKEGYHSIAVYGGDGTVNEVLLGMYRASSNSKLCIFPGGTANLLARSLGISQIKERAIRSIKFEKSKKIDLGICNDNVFSMFLSIGAVPEAIHEVTVEEKTKFGGLAYAKKSVDKLIDSEEYELKVATDTGSYTGHVDHLIVSLTNKMGKLTIIEDNKDEEGRAKVLILTDDSILKKLSVFRSALAGMAEQNENIKYFSAKDIEITSIKNTNINVDIDGDKGPYLPVKITVVKDFIEVYLPSKLIGD